MPLGMLSQTPSSLNTCDTFTLAFVVVVAAVVVVMGIDWFSRSGSIMAVIFSLGRNTKYEYSYYSCTVVSSSQVFISDVRHGANLGCFSTSH